MVQRVFLLNILQLFCSGFQSKWQQQQSGRSALANQLRPPSRWGSTTADGDARVEELWSHDDNEPFSLPQSLQLHLPRNDFSCVALLHFGAVTLKGAATGCVVRVAEQEEEVKNKTAPESELLFLSLEGSSPFFV